jgi:aspartyl aminopeptidase
LINILAEELGCEPKAIQDFELTLCDTQGAQCWGANAEFLSSPRLDNQAHCYSSMKALINYSSKQAQVDADVDISLVAMFDHEEVGSQSTGYGALPALAANAPLATIMRHAHRLITKK